jgi:TRAP-type C4-dicarboxylate transport system permease small subunit
MMKLPITQIILGALIVLATLYVLWWMVFGVTALLSDKVPIDSDTMVANYTPKHEVLFTITRYASGLLSGLGLAVIITGALWKKTKNKKNLTITQTIAGVLIVAVSAFIFQWGYTFEYIVAIEGGPVLDLARAMNLTLLVSLLGLAVVGVSIAQLVNSKKTANI